MYYKFTVHKLVQNYIQKLKFANKRYRHPAKLCLSRSLFQHKNCMRLIIESAKECVTGYLEYFEWTDLDYCYHYREALSVMV